MSVGLVDAEARKRAATDLDTSLLVEAPAGSGKTTLLVARILAWVRSGRARLPEIVAITFTEKAAADLRLRVREAIEGARAAASPVERPTLDQALADLELAPIRTIHGFCGDLIRQRPVEARVDPGFAVADPLTTGLLLDETWERWLERTADEAPPALEEAVALGVSVQALRELGSALVAERDLLEGLPAPVAETDALALNRAVRSGLAELLEAAPARARTRADTLVRHLEELVAWIRQTDALPEAEQITAVLTELPLRKPSRLGTQAAWGREPLARTRAELTELLDRVGEARARRLHNLAATLAGWLRGFVGAYRDRIRRLGLLDFHDLLAVTRDLLRERPDVRRDFQSRYRTILVDEFQDTDPLQLEIAFYLAEDPTGPPASRWDAVRLGQGRLFLVGDPKQSIYRFRRADIETYERARARVAQQGEILALATNFRAGRNLLEAVNRLFEAQMQPPEDGAYQPAYAPVRPAPTTPDGEGPLLLDWPPEAAPPAGAESRRAREAEALAALLARAVTTGAWPVRDRVGGTRAARFGDIVCLFRTLGGAAIYEDAFRAAGVPYRTVGGRHYYARSEVGWALAALTAIEDPYDPVALVAALRSPFFGAPDDAFLVHAAGGGAFSYLAPLPAGAHPALADAWTILRDLHARRTRESPAAVVEALYAETEVLATYALDPHGDQRVANLLRVLDTARALEAAGRPTFRALVRWLRAQDSGGYEESESPVAEEGDEVVRLMTVHAAKGLEFPVVILPDLEWDRVPATPRLVVERRPAGTGLGVSLGKVGDFPVETQNVTELMERETRRGEAEQLRLFYVATTRSRDHLVLPLLFGLTPRGFAAFCAPLLGDDGSPGTRRVLVDPGAPPVPAPRSTPVPALIPRQAWAAEREAALSRGRQPATAILHPGHRPTRGEGARLGALVHAALALADLARPSAAAAIEAAAARLGEAGERVATARRLVELALASPPYQRAAGAPRALRELPVAAVVDGRLVEGVVDLVLETPDGVVAVEVKLAPADEAARDQLAAYCRALAAAGLRVAEACLLVLGPDGAEVLPVAVPAS
ncbi:MAG TPA: UvrD-helicase domain-containing protein [Methylomirabilota bacterium]|nr:UvrD-helicase domain-containing protein [Methylomirabilota bacterium]